MNFNILLAQINPTVGNISGNLDKIINIIKKHAQNHQLIIFPEFALTGYPLEDLIFQEDLQQQVNNALITIKNLVATNYVILGHPEFQNNKIFNAASVFHNGKIIITYHKQALPNYSVFDEYRYFTGGTAAPLIFEINNHKLALIICEDLWHPCTIANLKSQQLDALICINASPYYTGKQQERYKVAYERLQELNSKHAKLIYLNLVGGQDELVFDGQSFVMAHSGELLFQAPAFIESTASIALNNLSTLPAQPQISSIAEQYQALVLALRDFVHKNNFKGVTLGLSGGIDSALTLALAVDAIGANNVHGVIMPSRFNAAFSALDAKKQADALHVKVSNVPIEPLYSQYVASLSLINNELQSLTLENIQARIRGNILMAISNQTGYLVLSTSNKSEAAVGYCTLYGDMSGGFAPIKDVLKTTVYQLAEYCNRDTEIIPARIITRAPSAELAPNQTDQDSLPTYELLDPIISAVLEYKIQNYIKTHPKTELEIINKVIKLIKKSEFKRYQAPPGPKISKHAFGKDWRMPITNALSIM